MLSENLLEMQVLGPHPRTSEQETLGVGQPVEQAQGDCDMHTTNLGCGFLN